MFKSPASFFLAALAASVLALAACGKPAQTTPQGTFNPEIMPYYYSFLADAQRHQTPVTFGDDLVGIDFGVLDQSILGLCTARVLKDKNLVTGNTKILGNWETVTISTSETTFDAQFKLLVYHELGHCLLGLGHTKNYNDIMYPILILSNDQIEPQWETQVANEFAQAHTGGGNPFAGGAEHASPVECSFAASNALVRSGPLHAKLPLLDHP